jgi:hypothetical protein
MMYCWLIPKCLERRPCIRYLKPEKIKDLSLVNPTSSGLESRPPRINQQSHMKVGLPNFW